MRRRRWDTTERPRHGCTGSRSTRCRCHHRRGSSSPDGQVTVAETIVSRSRAGRRRDRLAGGTCESDGPGRPLRAGPSLWSLGALVALRAGRPCGPGTALQALEPLRPLGPGSPWGRPGPARPASPWSAPRPLRPGIALRALATPCGPAGPCTARIALGSPAARGHPARPARPGHPADRAAQLDQRRHVRLWRRRGPAARQGRVGRGHRHELSLGASPRPGETTLTRPARGTLRRRPAGRGLRCVTGRDRSRSGSAVAAA